MQLTEKVFLVYKTVYIWLINNLRTPIQHGRTARQLLFYLLTLLPELKTLNISSEKIVKLEQISDEPPAMVTTINNEQ